MTGRLPQPGAFRAAQFLIAAAVLTGLVACQAPTPSPSVERTSIAVLPPRLPQPLAAMPLSGSMADQSRVLADAFEQRRPARAQAMLAAFSLAGLPVVNGDDHSLTTNGDTIGVSWSEVWAVATVPDPRTRVPLSQVATLFAADAAGDLDTSAVAADILGGLRSSLNQDPRPGGPGPIALLVQQEALRAGSVDIADPATSADQVLITLPTAALLLSAGLLDSVAGPHAPKQTGDVGVQHTQPSGCADDDAGQWSLWILSKAAAGVKIPGLVQWDGLFQTLLAHVTNSYVNMHLPVDVEALHKGLGTVAGAAGYVAATITALNVIIAILTHDAAVDLTGQGPLVRTHSSRTHGETRDIVVNVRYDYRKLGVELDEAINCLLAMLGAVAGNNTTLPEPGGIDGAVVTIEGRQGFADRLNTVGAYVLFPEGILKKPADNGAAVFPVAGRAQRDDVSDEAAQLGRTFTVRVKSTLDPSNASTIARTFLDSFLCGGGFAGGDLLACVDAISDVVKQFDYDLGEWSFDLTDWAEGERRFSVEASWKARLTPGRGENIDTLLGSANFQGEIICLPPQSKGHPRGWQCSGEVVGSGSGEYIRYQRVFDPTITCSGDWRAHDIRYLFHTDTHTQDLTAKVIFEEDQHVGAGSAVCGHEIVPPLPITALQLPLPEPGQTTTVTLPFYDGSYTTTLVSLP